MFLSSLGLFLLFCLTKKKRENRIPSFLPCLCKHTSLIHWQLSLFYWCAVAEPRFLNSAALLFPCFERKWLTYAQAHCHNLLLWVFLFLFAIITSVLAFFFCDARGALSSDSTQSCGVLKLHARFWFSYILHSMERKRVIILVKPSLRLFVSFFFNLLFYRKKCSSVFSLFFFPTALSTWGSYDTYMKRAFNVVMLVTVVLLVFLLPVLLIFFCAHSRKYIYSELRF